MANGKGDTQYAALPWRRAADGAVEVLLITSRETRRWVVPKGWPMAGLSPAESAAQEAFEEAGLRGEIAAAPLGAYAYDKVGKTRTRRLNVEVFALAVREELADWPERTERTREWTSLAEAAARVREPELKTILAGFAPPA